MREYVESLFNVFNMINQNESVKKDRRFQIIALVIFNYVRKMAKDNDVDLRTVEIKKPINLMPIFEYISHNNIQLFDFNNIDHSFILELTLLTTLIEFFSIFINSNYCIVYLNKLEVLG